MQYQFVIGIVTVMTMATTIQQAVYPLLLASSVLGLGVYSPKKLYLSILYNVTMWTAYFNTYYYMVISSEALVHHIKTFNKIFLTCGILILLTSLILSIYHDKKFRMIMERLTAVDNTLEELGTPKMYPKLYNYAKQILIGWLVYSYIINIIDMVYWVYETKSSWCVIVSCVVNHLHHVNMFVDLLFVTFLWYIGTRFDKVNEYIKYLLVKEEHGLRYAWRKVVPITHAHVMYADNYKHVLWTSMHLHLELCQIARELNEMFGVQMTMEMIGYMLHLTKLFRNFFMHIRTNSKFIMTSFIWVSMYMWTLMYIIRLFVLNYFCESVSAKANETYAIIHHLTHLLRYVDIRKEIYQFALQTIYHPLKFTGMGLFYFGSGFLRKFFLKIATFLIIVVQTTPRPDSITEAAL